MATQRDLATQLLQRASDDEAAAKAMLPIVSVTDVIVASLAQQGVEKSLKAVLAAGGVDFPFTHDIGRLAALCKSAGTPPPDDLREADKLTPYASTVRYDSEDPELVDRETALRWITAAVQWARTIIAVAAEPPPA